MASVSRKLRIQPHEFNDFVIWLCRAEPGETNNFAFLSQRSGAAGGSLLSLACTPTARKRLYFLPEIKHGNWMLDLPLFAWFAVIFHFYIMLSLDSPTLTRLSSRGYRKFFLHYVNLDQVNFLYRKQNFKLIILLFYYFGINLAIDGYANSLQSLERHSKCLSKNI